jgi:hypothetical protein
MVGLLLDVLLITLQIYPNILTTPGMIQYDIMIKMKSSPYEKRKLGKWLELAHRVGQALCYCVLPASGKPII